MGKTKPGGDLQKLKSRVAAKARRKNENDQFNELVLLNPWITQNPPDKSTVIRLTTSYIGLINVLRNSINAQKIGIGHSSLQGIEQLSLEALDGFIIILSREGRVIYVNSKVSTYLGFPESEVLGKSIYNFVLKRDWQEVARKLKGPLPSQDNPNIRQPEVDSDDEICELPGPELSAPYFANNNKTGDQNQKVQFSVRVQCNMVRRGNSRNSNFRILRFTGCIGATGDFAGLVQPVWSPDVGDLPVNQSVFISRLSPDLKLLFCEGRIHRFMDTEAKDIVGRVVYPFYHPTDLFHIQKMHSKLLAKGQCSTEPYRWMNKEGGWVWMQSKTCQIRCETSGQNVMLCVNYVLSAVENKGVVVGLNPPTQEKVIEKDRKEIEQDSNDAYIYDPQVKALTQNLEECKITEINNYDLPQNEPKQEPDLKCDGFSQVFPCPTASTTQQAESISNDPYVLPRQNLPSPSDLEQPLPNASDMWSYLFDSINILSEGSAFGAAQFFLDGKFETLLDSPKPNLSTCDLGVQNMSSYSAKRRPSLSVNDMLSEGQTDNFNNNDFYKTNFRSIDEMCTAGSHGVVNQPGLMNFNAPLDNNTKDGNVEFNDDFNPYVMEFNTQLLNESCLS